MTDVCRYMLMVDRALCLAGIERSSYQLDGHLYAPLQVAYPERGGGVTSLQLACDSDVRDSDVSESARAGGAMTVTYTSAGCCCVSPVRAADAGVQLDHDEGRSTACSTMKRLICCCHKRQQVRRLLWPPASLASADFTVKQAGDVVWKCLQEKLNYDVAKTGLA